MFRAAYIFTATWKERANVLEGKEQPHRNSVVQACVNQKKMTPISNFRLQMKFLGGCELWFVNGVNCFVTKTEVLVFPDLCSNEVNCFITKTEILLNLLLRGGEMSKRFAL